MRFACFILAILTAIAPACAEPLTFLALASVRDEVRYERFVEAVEPIWRRHGMRVIARMALEDADYHDAIFIAVDSREGFNAYIADPDYKAIAKDRIEAVDALVILEGPSSSLNVPGPDALVSVVFMPDCAGVQSGMEVSLVAPVKGGVSEPVENAGCVGILSADDAVFGPVTTGFSARVR